jgi:hypothetical protein
MTHLGVTRTAVGDDLLLLAGAERVLREGGTYPLAAAVVLDRPVVVRGKRTWTSLPARSCSSDAMYRSERWLTHRR